MTSLKQLQETATEEFFLAGNSTCAGCGLEIALRWAMKALGPKTALVAPASCLNVVVGLWPKTAPTFPFINMAFAAGAAAATGLDAAFKAKGWDDMTSLVFAGDGGTTDIGIQGLSGAAERNSNIIYVCYDNEAYMNTGIQRSSSTPHGAKTTTTPFGKQRFKKNLPAIMAAHNIPYVATACTSYLIDLYEKFKKAKEIKGCKYIHILAPCPPGWGFPSEETIKMGKLAIETGFWILYEIENGEFKLSKPSKRFLDASKRKPIQEYLLTQKRFNTISETGIVVLQNNIDAAWKHINLELQIKESEI
jgi:pyruvate ferredoxin oxidoreductase beta subunit